MKGGVKRTIPSVSGKIIQEKVLGCECVYQVTPKGLLLFNSFSTLVSGLILYSDTASTKW